MTNEFKDKSAETTLHEFFIQSPTPMVILEGPNHFIRLANPPYENLVKRRVTGKTALEAFSLEEVKHFIPLLDKVYQTGKPYIGRELPLNIPNENGVIEEHWVNVNYYPHFDEKKNVKGILCDVHEVTDQVRAKKLIQESEENFRLIANTLPHIIWTAGPDGIIDWQSDEYFKYTGLNSKTIFNGSESPMHPDDIAITTEKWKTSVVTGENFEVEHRIRKEKSGEYRWNLAKARPVREPGGKVVKWVGSTTDIHDLKMAQEALKRSEKQFRTLANSLPLIIWTATPEGFVDWYNDWWYKYLGATRDVVWDDPEKQPMHPDDIPRTLEIWNKALKSGDQYLIEQRFKRGSDKQYRWHLVRGVPIRDSDGKITKWVGANVDIHDHKNVVHKLEEEQELRERFVAALSHDLRTPITSAKLSAQTLRRTYIKDEKILRTTDRMVANLDRVDNMIQDLLDANRLSAGEKIPIHRESCDLSLVVHNTLEELRFIHGNRFIIEEDHCAIMGKWEIAGIRRILENLCNNAIKYGDPDKPITISMECLEKNQALLAVHNFGNPIDENEIEHLFELYSRSTNAKTSDKKGWGIGLMLVKGLVDAHNGSIEVTSDEVKGTTFKVKLPIEACDQLDPNYQ